MKTSAQAGEIEQLIPHRHPFLFLNEILSVTPEETIGLHTFSRSSPILQKNSSNFVPGTLIIESMAQCGGAGVKLLGVMDGLFGLVSIEHAEFFKVAEYEQELKYVIKNIKLSGNIIKQSGVAYSQDVPVAEASWMCIKLSE
jgi:3-hydroxyacyl-[acyl-carrier-protein] dehydratase